MLIGRKDRWSRQENEPEGSKYTLVHLKIHVLCENLIPVIIVVQIGSSVYLAGRWVEFVIHSSKTAVFLWNLSNWLNCSCPFLLLLYLFFPSPCSKFDSVIYLFLKIEIKAFCPIDTHCNEKIIFLCEFNILIHLYIL